MGPAHNILTRCTTHDVPRLCSSHANLVWFQSTVAHKQANRFAATRSVGAEDRLQMWAKGRGRLTIRPSGARPNLDKGQGRGGENTSGVWSLSRERSQFHTLVSLLGLQPASLDNLTSCFHTSVELKIMHRVVQKISSVAPLTVVLHRTVRPRLQDGANINAKSNKLCNSCTDLQV